MIAVPEVLIVTSPRSSHLGNHVVRIEKSNCEKSLRIAESGLISKLKTMFPNGSNVNDGFCRHLFNKRK